MLVALQAEIPQRHQAEPLECRSQRLFTTQGAIGLSGTNDFRSIFPAQCIAQIGADRCPITGQSGSLGNFNNRSRPHKAMREPANPEAGRDGIAHLNAARLCGFVSALNSDTHWTYSGGLPPLVGSSCPQYGTRLTCEQARKERHFFTSVALPKSDGGTVSQLSTPWVCSAG